MSTLSQLLGKSRGSRATSTGLPAGHEIEDFITHLHIIMARKIHGIKTSAIDPEVLHVNSMTQLASLLTKLIFIIMDPKTEKGLRNQSYAVFDAVNKIIDVGDKIERDIRIGTITTDAMIDTSPHWSGYDRNQN